MKTFKIRSSQAGKIMTEPRSKADKEAGILSNTAKSYCQEWVKEQIYERKKEIDSKFIQKGNIMEDNSIDFLAENLNLGFLIKNEKYFENDFLTGTPDIILHRNDLVIDVKNSWDCWTFPLFDEAVNKDYYYQLQCYMELTGVKKSKLVYTLMNTPDHLIEKEYYWYCKNNGIDPDVELYNQFYEKMTFDNIADKYRIKVYDIAYDLQVIEKIYSQVEKCRLYIQHLYENQLN